MKRLLEILRHDDCDDSVVCDCSLSVINHLNDLDATADLSAALPYRVDESQSSPLRPSQQDGDQQLTLNAIDRSPPTSSLSSAVRDHDMKSGRCQTFKLPDIQVRLTPPRQSGPNDRSSTVLVAPDVINDPHYTVV